MKRPRIATTLIVGAIVVSALAAYAQATGHGEALPSLSSGLNRSVIVIMKNQLAGADAASDQAPLMSELRRINATRIKPFRLVNSFAATVSADEVERLKTNPAVAQVIPDVFVHAARRSRFASTMIPAPNASSSPTPHVIPGACPAHGGVLLEPEALLTTHTDSEDPQVPTARSLGVNGAGVKIAWIADGVDPSNVNFIRPNKKSVFIDYQDFSGDGAGMPTTGGEAFLDSNAIAGQGIHVYNVNGYSAQTDPAACKVRIEGVAPGAALVGLDTDGLSEYMTESNLLEAIDYAVSTDHVDVLNESFGSNPFPDVTALDVTKQFNDAAVKAGVTVMVASGDAGVANTIGSPATDPNVISVGASTTFRFYAQTNYAAARYFATTGWLNDNMSSLSSGGFSETGGTVNLVAPGDLAFASCDASPNYSDCENYLNQPSDIEYSGGTSLSAPLTSGAAALVIQAYRKFHHGIAPTPALIKQILTSTATDLGVPAIEEGAGLLNTYKAVLLAESIQTGDGSPASIGQSLVLSENQLNAVDAPGTSHTWPVTITNAGAVGQSVQVSGRTFGPSENVQTGSVILDDTTSLQFVNYGAIESNYAVFTFEVPKRVQRLNASIAYPGMPANGLNARVRLILIDPRGRFAAHSEPQGVGNFGAVDVREPVEGKWIGVIFGDVASMGGTNGTIPWQVSTQQFAPFGSIAPSSFYLAPGHSQTIRVTASTPSTAGDSAGSIVLTSSGGGVDRFVGVERNSIPVTLRSLVDVANGGTFSGVLTGGNGGDPGEGQIDYYQFNVGAGHTSITANLALTNDVDDMVGSYLVSPDGTALGFGQNSLNGTNSTSLTAYTLNPVAGTWTLVVDFAEPVVGDEISQAFTGNIVLDDISASASGLPNSATTELPAGVPVTIPVTITNNGVAPEAFFIDARLNTTTSLALALQTPPASPNGYALPLGSTSDPNVPEWLVPTEASSVQAAATATLPIEFDYGPSQGDPDLYGPPTTTDNAAGSYAPSGGTLQPGVWFSEPSEIGPYPTPAPAGFFNMSLTATAKAFDPAVTTAIGDLWLASLDPPSVGSFAPVTVNPGETTVIPVTITPSGASGTVVSGNLYVDDFLSAVPPYGQITGDELAAIPYAYTIK